MVSPTASKSSQEGRVGFEIKYTDTPKTTKSMRIAIEDLELDHLYVVYPGTPSFPLDASITALALKDLPVPQEI